MCSHCGLFPVVVTSLEQVVYKVDDGNRLATSCFNKTKKWCLIVKSCYELVVINSLTTCYVQTISDFLKQLVTSLLSLSVLLQDDNNSVPDLSTTGNKQCEQILLKSCVIFTRV